MWREGESGDGRDWRGSIHDVASGRRLYITAPGEITDFVAMALTQPPPDKPLA